MSTPVRRVFSKAPSWGQQALAGAAGFALFTVALGASASILPPSANTPSGEPVPRWVTLKKAPVNARGGPGEDYKLLWVYPSRGIPLQIVEESQDWRRVCDPEGGVGWVHRRALEQRRSVMRTSSRDLILRDQPSDTARASAVMSGRSTAEIISCKTGWCRVSVDHAKGWVRANEVWGTAEKAQCR